MKIYELKNYEKHRTAEVFYDADMISSVKYQIHCSFREELSYVTGAETADDAIAIAELYVKTGKHMMGRSMLYDNNIDE
jgi:hypothetical protein